ncbi:unnamed protein product [Discula destructiva]
MSHDTRPVVDQSKAKALSDRPEAVQASRPKRQPSEMLQRWKVESRNDVPITEKIYVQCQNQEQGSRR